MWSRSQFCSGGSRRFFYLSFGNGGLKEYYNLNFNLLYYHKINPDLFDDKIPWEKEIYINLLVKKVKEEEEQKKLKEMARKAARRK